MTDPRRARRSVDGSRVARPRPTADLTERVVDSRVVHKGHYMEFRVDTIERADGTRGQRDIVGHPGAVAMLAIDEADRVLMVRQFRLAGRRRAARDPGRDARRRPCDRRGRGPRDRVAARARGGDRLPGPVVAEARLVLDRARASRRSSMHLYLATDLEPAIDGRLGPDEDEHLELERVPVAGSARGGRARRDPRREVARRAALVPTGCGTRGPSRKRDRRTPSAGSRSGSNRRASRRSISAAANVRRSIGATLHRPRRSGRSGYSGC